MKNYIIHLSIVFSVSIISGQDSDFSVKKFKVGDVAPNWSLKAESGKFEFLENWTVKKNRQLRKPSIQPDRHVVLFTFFATWCPPCVAQLQPLEEVYQKYRSKKIKFFIIDETEPESDAPDTKTLLYDKNITMPYIKDNWKVGSKYGVKAIPTIFIIDKYGIIQNIRVAFNEDEDFVGELSEIIDQLLK